LKTFVFWETGPKLPVPHQQEFTGFYPHTKLTGTSIGLLEVCVLLSFDIALKNKLRKTLTL
jgi:hypothetical protein